jgi:histone H3/H4
MHDERYIQQCAKDLIAEFGEKALEIAERKMRELMEKNDVKEASLWLAVLYEIHRSDSQQVH